MDKISEQYDKFWFQRLNDRNEQFADIIADSIYDLLKPVSVIDLGCGTCNFINRFSEKGCYTDAVDGCNISEFVHEGVIFYQQDLRENTSLGNTYNLVLCFNVAEHIDGGYESVFLDNIARVCDNWLIFSAAPPGVGGTDHVNCRPFKYWVKEFEKQNIFLDKDKTDRLKKTWQENDIIFHYWKTMGVFRRIIKEAKIPKRIREFENVEFCLQYM